MHAPDGRNWIVISDNDVSTHKTMQNPKYGDGRGLFSRFWKFFI